MHKPGSVDNTFVMFRTVSAKQRAERAFQAKGATLFGRPALVSEAENPDQIDWREREKPLKEALKFFGLAVTLVSNPESVNLC